MTPGKEKNPVEIISFLALTLGMLDAANMVSHSKHDPSTLAIVENYLLTQGIRICALSNELILIYRAGDPVVTAIRDANLEELTEFLANENTEVRAFAKWKLDTLTDDKEKL